MLISRNVEFPLTHDLEILLEVVQDAGIEVPGTLMSLGRLTPYAVQTRYPRRVGRTSRMRNSPRPLSWQNGPWHGRGRW
ncbi:MAG: HEPN domain-containing protein [Egibacteraceae bacterium]